MKKRFKETAVGKFLQSKGFDTVIDAVGTVVPGVKLLGDVKTLVMGHPAYQKLSQDEQLQFIDLHDQEIEELDKRLNDLQDARDMYEKKSEMADYIARRVTLYNLPIIFLLVIALIVCTWLLKDNVLLALISSTITGVVTYLFNERQTLITFFFGSSAGSKEKQKAILDNKTNA